LHLLLIEDNPDLVANIADFLEDHDHSLDIAYNRLRAHGHQPGRATGALGREPGP
jgi:DNA-binding response OmpR family regulator